MTNNPLAGVSPQTNLGERTSAKTAEDARGPGCPRHEGDPHNLCEACWALEPDPAASDSPRVPEAAQPKKVLVGAPDKERPDAREGQRYPAGSVAMAIDALELSYSYLRDKPGIAQRIDVALHYLYRARELNEGIPHPYGDDGRDE